MQETLHSEEIFLLLIAKPVFKFVKKEFEKTHNQTMVVL